MISMRRWPDVFVFGRWGYLVGGQESGIDQSVEDLTSRFAVTDAPTRPGRDRARPLQTGLAAERCGHLTVEAAGLRAGRLPRPETPTTTPPDRGPPVCPVR